MGKTSVLCKWRYWCPIRNKWLVTRYKTTAAMIAIEHPEATPVVGTEETLTAPDNLYENSTGVVQSGYKG